MHATPQNLAAFFDQWSYFSRHCPLEQKLRRYFDEIQDVLPRRSQLQNPVQYQPGDTLDLPILEAFLSDLSQMIPMAQRAGFLCNPWEIAAIKRDEGRNSSVLAWWLNPTGNHGHGGALLSSLLGEFHNPSLNLPATVGKPCSVRAESCPDGDAGNRVDIEIDDPGFLLIIEVKIDAGEGKEQLSRYCRVAQSRAGARPWAVLFLTPQGRKPEADPTRAEADRQLMEQHIIPLSWRHIAFHLERAVKPAESGFVGRLARTFCQHIRKF